MITSTLPKDNILQSQLVQLGAHLDQELGLREPGHQFTVSDVDTLIRFAGLALLCGWPAEDVRLRAAQLAREAGVEPDRAKKLLEVQS